jgi:hypothetical protein
MHIKSRYFMWKKKFNKFEKVKSNFFIASFLFEAEILLKYGQEKKKRNIVRMENMKKKLRSIKKLKNKE